MNDAVLILEGVRGPSWLAGRSCRIGLAAPMRYPQGSDGSLIKLNSQIIIATGFDLNEMIERDFAGEMPDGLILHRPEGDARSALLALAQTTPDEN
ncbi:MAG: hypothetical protein EP348_06805 [Alphaproteobacteria bacterium]|nr:MAG: hypothetical protein EP348_06805 [Alphaproteobacteria bacterium]